MTSSDGGDARFQAMMKDFVKTHFNQPVSTEEFKAIVEKHMTTEMNIDRYREDGLVFQPVGLWHAGSGLRLEYKVTSDGMMTGKITQSGVSDDFVMLVPIYVDMGKGWAKLGAARIIGNSSVEITESNCRPCRSALRACCDERCAGDEY